MTIFVGNREIKRIYVGGEGYIKKAYYGRKLVYEIQSLFESGVAGTYTLFVDTDGVYEISICGAGGGAGGSATSHNWLGANGGSGAAFKGLVALTRGTYTLMIGSGGAGGSASGANAPRGSAGTLSRIVDSSNNVLISAGAGSGGHGTGNYDGGGGQGGTLTMGTANVVSYQIQTNGATSSTVSILGNGYGAGGARRSHASGTAGTNGYIRIIYYGSVSSTYYCYRLVGDNQYIYFKDQSVSTAGSREMYYSDNYIQASDVSDLTNQETATIVGVSQPYGQIDIFTDSEGDTGPWEPYSTGNITG